VLGEPLSFWGGVDAATGLIVDRRHPQVGESVRDRILLMPSGRGSSSSSTVLAEALRRGTAPAAVVLKEVDEILVLGSIVAGELYGRSLPVVLLADADYRAIETGDLLETLPSGGVTVRGG
jgi:predicted aconitase with swiveling domain